MALREILIALGIEIDERGQKKAEGAVDRLNTGLGKLKKIAMVAGAVFITGAIARGFRNMIVQAGDAAEIANKFGAVFGDVVGPKISKALEDMALRTGQSRIAIQEMTADAGALVKPLLGDAAAAGDLAQAMTETALDLASFENVLPQEALGALRSAIIGSSEPMLRFGVDTRQAALAQFALDQGLTKSIKQMSIAEVTALRMSLIMERLGDKGAVGDATTTAGSFANRLRALDGRFRDLQAEVGKQFLPIATDLVGVLIELATNIGPTLVSAAKGAITVFRVLGSAVRALATPFQRLDTALLFLASVSLAALLIAFNTVGAAATLAALKAAAAWLIAALPIIVMAVLIAAISVAIFALIEDLERMGEGSESVTGTMITGFTDLIDEVGGVGPAMAEMLATAFEFWAKFFQDTLGINDEFITDFGNDIRNAWTTVVTDLTKQWNEFIGNILKTGRAVSGFFGDLFGGGETAAPGGRRRAVAGARVLRQAGATGTAVPVTAGMAPAAGATTMINQPRMETTVNIDASGSSAGAREIAGAVRREVDASAEQMLRQTQDAFAVALPEG